MEKKYLVQDDTWPSRKWNKEGTEFEDESGNSPLSQLYNPEMVKAILLTNGDYIEAGADQAFQVYYTNKKLPNVFTSIELWQELSGGRIIRVQRWTRKSIISTY